MTTIAFQSARSTAGDIACPKCRAGIGELCRASKTGKALTNNRSYHSDRERLHQEVRTTTVAHYVLRHDVPRTTLRKGDVIGGVIRKDSPLHLVVVSTNADEDYRGLVIFSQDAVFDGYTTATVEQGREISNDRIRVYTN